MSQADGNRYFFPQSLQRPQNCVEMNEIFDSDDEDGIVSDGKTARVKRHFIHHNNQVTLHDSWRTHKNLKLKLFKVHNNEQFLFSDVVYKITLYLAFVLGIKGYP